MTDYAGVGFLYSTSDTVATFDLYGVAFPYSTSDTVATFNLYGVTFPYTIPNISSTTNDAILVLGSLELSASGITGGIGTAGIQLPSITFQSNMLGSAFNLTLTLEASGLTGAVGNSTLTLPLVLTATELNGAIGNSELVLPYLILDTGYDIILTFAPFQITANGLSGEVGHSDITFPTFLTAGWTIDAAMSFSTMVITNGENTAHLSFRPLEIVHLITAALTIPLSLTAEDRGAMLTLTTTLIARDLGLALHIPVSMTGTHFCELRLNLPAIYQCTLSGGDLPAIVLPMENFQAKITSGSYSYLTVVIPAAHAVIEAISARQENGYITIEKGYQLPDGSQYYDTLIKARFDDFSFDSGTRTSSATLRGFYSTFISRGVTRTVTQYNYFAIQNGRQRIRLPYIDTFIRPGDYLQTPDSTFLIGEISYTVSTTNAVMEIVE